MDTQKKSFFFTIGTWLLSLIVSGSGVGFFTFHYTKISIDKNEGQFITIVNSSNIHINGKKIVARQDNKEDVVKEIIDAYQETRIENEELARQNKLLVSRERIVQYINPKFRFEGINKNVNITNPIALIDGEAYISKKMMPLITKNNIQIDIQSGLVSIDTANSTGKKYPLFEVCPPYQYHGDARQASGENPFNMSGKQYTDGFTSPGWPYNGYALINLQREYSSLSFDVGHVDGTDLYNKGTNLRVFLDGKLSFTKYIPEDSVAQRITVPLNYANELKIQTFEGGGWYGIANITVSD